MAASAPESPPLPCGSYTELHGLCHPTLGPGVVAEQDAKQGRAPDGFLTLTPALKCKQV